jgi:AraC-like DNA-binding protein
VLSRVGFDAAIFDRDPRRLREFDTEYLLLETYDRGRNCGRAGDIVTELEAGSVHVFDMAKPWRTQTTAVSCRSVVIPYGVIGYDPSRQRPYARLAAHSPRTAMLLAAMGALFETDPGPEAEDAGALAGSFVSLVRRLMFHRLDGDVEEGRSHGDGLLLRQFIEDRLADPDLGPQRLCEVFGMSRAGLYRLFSEEGGVRHYITSRRLDRCFDELCQGEPRRGRVRRVAERWGFLDAKSFNRAFHGRFGIAPSECLPDPSGTAEDGMAGHPVQDWLKKR